MPFPQCPSKHGSDPVVTPERSRDYFTSAEERRSADIPESVALCFSRGQLDELLQTYPSERIGGYYGELYRLEEGGGAVGIAGGFGIGAPTTAMMVEDLVADGVERVVAFGYAGCLDPAVGAGDVVVCTKALRDEGTSHHYLEPSTFAYPDEVMTAELERWFGERSAAVHSGPSWTTDAIYRETEREVAQYGDDGIVTVEMEAAAVFAVAEYHDIDAAAAFVVSDHLSESGWDPQFERIAAETRAFGEGTIEWLTDKFGR